MLTVGVVNGFFLNVGIHEYKYMRTWFFPLVVGWTEADLNVILQFIVRKGGFFHFGLLRTECQYLTTNFSISEMLVLLKFQRQISVFIFSIIIHGYQIAVEARKSQKVPRLQKGIH